ncbi:recombination-associated protein RdgC [Enterobacter hormaechei]|uniref:recombination-associated protein RdgC n=1 Tax=Enterobacter hormaechei TaxID=158836 RepID=UPI003D365ACE
MKTLANFRVYRATVADIQKSNILGLTKLLAGEFSDFDIAEDFEAELRKNRAADPFASAWAKWGFSAPDFFYEDSLVHVANSTLRFQTEKRERLLPGDVLRKAIAEEGRALQDKQEEPLNKKQWAEIKDVVTARLLPKSHIVVKTVPAVMFQSGKDVLLVIFSSSAKVCEDVQHLLRSSFGGWPFYPFTNSYAWPVEGFMTGILRGDYRHFEAINTVTLSHPDEGVVTYKDQDLTEHNEPLQEHLNNHYTVKKMAFAYHMDGHKEGDSYTTMKMDAKGGFSAWKLSDVKDMQAREYGQDGMLEATEAYDLIFTRDVNTMISQIDIAMKKIDEEIDGKDAETTRDDDIAAAHLNGTMHQVTAQESEDDDAEEEWEL